MEIPCLTVNKNLDRFFQTIYECFILGNLELKFVTLKK
jgi:hypothetical protein